MRYDNDKQIKEAIITLRDNPDLQIKTREKWSQGISRKIQLADDGRKTVEELRILVNSY